MTTLPALLPGEAERILAIETAQYVAGPVEEMKPGTLAMFASIRSTLALGPLGETMVTDPLAAAARGEAGEGTGTSA